MARGATCARLGVKMGLPSPQRGSDALGDLFVWEGAPLPIAVSRCMQRRIVIARIERS
jgi:hypothetical protein